MLRRGCIAVLIGALHLAGAPAWALEFETLSTKAINADDLLSGKCTHRLSGEIEAGDAKIVQAALEAMPIQEHDDLNFQVCLDSPGGNLTEGFRIGRMLHDDFYATFVGAGATCVSACGIIFMHGRVAFWESFVPMRVLHPAGRVGFHAPSLSLGGNGQEMVPTALVDAAYSAALANLSAMVDGALSGSSEYDIIPLGLLSEMLATPPESMRFVETLRDVFSWQIQIYPHDLKAPEGFAMDVGRYQLCANFWFTIPEDSMINETVTAQDAAWYANTPATNRPTIEPGFTLLEMDGLNVQQCLVRYDREWDYFEVKAFVEGSQVGHKWLPPIYLFAPGTKLRDIAP